MFPPWEFQCVPTKLDTVAKVPKVMKSQEYPTSQQLNTGQKAISSERFCCASKYITFIRHQQIHMGSKFQKLTHKSEPLQPLPVTSHYWWWPSTPCVSLVSSQETPLCTKPHSCVNNEKMQQQHLPAQLFRFWILSGRSEEASARWVCPHEQLPSLVFGEGCWNAVERIPQVIC